MKSFVNDYLLLNLKTYFGDGYDIPICVILFGVAVGMILATLLIYLQKKALYKLAKQLIRHDVTSKENAKTLEELGLSKNKKLLRMLRAGGQTKSMVFIIEDASSAEESPIERTEGKKSCKFVKFFWNAEEYAKTKAEKQRFFKNKIYTDGNKLIKTQGVFETGAPSLVSTLICICAIAVLFFVLIIAMPDILSWIF